MPDSGNPDGPRNSGIGIGGKDAREQEEVEIADDDRRQKQDGALPASTCVDLTQPRTIRDSSPATVGFRRMFDAPQMEADSMNRRLSCITYSRNARVLR